MGHPDIAFLRKGDELHWEAALQWLWPRAHQAASRHLDTLSRHEVEDVALRAITEAAEQVADGHVESFAALEGLVMVIAARKALSHARQLLAKRRDVRAGQPLETGAQEPPCPGPGPLDHLNAVDLAHLLARLLAVLPPLDHALIRDYWLHGLKQRELAERHQLPPGTVAVKLSRALEKVRKALAHDPLLMQELREAMR